MNQSRDDRPGAVPDELASALERLRAEVDRVDRAILAELNRRARLVQEIGALKRRAAVPVYSAARERDLIAALAAENPGPFPDAAIAPVFREIVSATRSLESRLRIAYLGPEGTFAHEAARARFGASAELAPAPTIGEVFAAVERGRADLGVVPVENTTQGVVTETLDTFVEARVALCGEVVLAIRQNLLSRTGRLEEVRRVASHPQGLAQCRLWLDHHLPRAERVETPSTAAAARLAAEDAAVAAIGSAIAGETYGLACAAAAIEDRRDNTTRFLLLGRDAPGPSGNDLTTVVFTVRKTEAGALYRLLEPFARLGVNLTAIHARPMPGRAWEYLFFLDIEGHASDEPVAKALADAASAASSHRVLGSFPRAQAAEVAP
jgi:chorismate mutase/prephenate dehydratase